MNKGRIMYQGSVSSVPEYFETRASPVPLHYNPADWIMVRSVRSVRICELPWLNRILPPFSPEPSH